MINDLAPALPLYITENGAAYPDEVTADGTVEDAERQHYFELHTSASPRRSSRACR